MKKLLLGLLLLGFVILALGRYDQLTPSYLSIKHVTPYSTKIPNAVTATACTSSVINVEGYSNITLGWKLYSFKGGTAIYHVYFQEAFDSAESTFVSPKITTDSTIVDYDTTNGWQYATIFFDQCKNLRIIWKTALATNDSVKVDSTKYIKGE